MLGTSVEDVARDLEVLKTQLFTKIVDEGSRFKLTKTEEVVHNLRSGIQPKDGEMKSSTFMTTLQSKLQFLVPVVADDDMDPTAVSSISPADMMEKWLCVARDLESQHKLVNKDVAAFAGWSYILPVEQRAEIVALARSAWERTNKSVDTEKKEEANIPRGGAAATPPKSPCGLASKINDWFDKC